MNPVLSDGDLRDKQTEREQSYDYRKNVNSRGGLRQRLVCHFCYEPAGCRRNLLGCDGDEEHKKQVVPEVPDIHLPGPVLSGGEEILRIIMVVAVAVDIMAAATEAIIAL